MDLHIRFWFYHELKQHINKHILYVETNNRQQEWPILQENTPLETFWFSTENYYLSERGEKPSCNGAFYDKEKLLTG